MLTLIIEQFFSSSNASRNTTSLCVTRVKLSALSSCCCCCCCCCSLWKRHPFFHFLKVGEFFSGGLLPRIECSLLIYFSQRTTLSSVSRFLSSSCVPLKTFGIVLLASNLGRISRISPPGVFSSSVACTDNTLRHLLSSNLSLLLWRRTLCGVRTYIPVYIYIYIYARIMYYAYSFVRAFCFENLLCCDLWTMSL